MTQLDPGLGLDLGMGPCPAHSPSFNEYSSATFSKIASRVVSEFEFENDAVLYSAENDAVLYSAENDVVAEEKVEKEDESSFEFPDEIFNNVQIQPRFPLFNTDLVFAETDWRDEFDFPSRRIPLRKLMISERESSVTESCSSSEADDLEGLSPESYCVWNPAKEEMRKKSKSTGYSKKWKIRDLLYRSNSDGDGRKKEMRSNSPYRQDPVGFLAKMNGLSRTIQPF